MEHNIPLHIPAFELLFQALPSSYLILSPDLHILAANDSYLQAAGKTRDAILGRYIGDIFPENPQPGETASIKIMLDSVQHVLQHKTAHHIPSIRYNIPSPQSEKGDVESRYWAITNTPILAADGTVTFIIQEARNITEQVKSEQEFIVNHHNLELLSKASGGTVWEVDLKQNKLKWSESIRTAFGYEEAALSSDISFWVNYIYPPDLGFIKQYFSKTFKTRDRVFSIAFRFKKAAGNYTNVLSHGYVLYDKAGVPLRLIGSSLDTDTHQQQQQQLAISNQRFEYVAKTTSDVIWDMNLQDDTIWWNEGMETLYGYRKDEIIPDSSFWSSRVHPDDVDRVTQSLNNVIKSTHTAWQEEYRFRKADGTYLLVKDIGHILRDASGKPIRMVGALRDVTEKRRYQQEVQDNLNWTRDLLNSLPLLIWTATPEGNIDFYTNRSSEYTGANLHELKMKGWADFIHPDDKEESMTLWETSLKTGKAYTVENRFRSKYGEYRWFMVNSVPIHDEGGHIIKWVGSCIDIEPQKQAQLALEKSNRKFKMLAESIPHIIWSATPAGEIDYFNKRYYDYTKMTAEASLGSGWLLSLHPDDRARAIKAWKLSIATGQHFYIETRFQNINTGDYRWFLTRAVPIRDEAGTIVKWFGTTTDIEDHKKAEEELLEKNMELERVNKDLDSFVYAASHDLKAPIANMAGLFRELTRRTEFKDIATAKVVEMFNRSLEQIHSTIQDLSEVVRVQKSKDQPLELIDLARVTDDVMLSIQDMITKSRAVITTDFSEIPAIPFTKSGLTSILFNLISNAIKYKSPDRNPEINITTKVKGDYIELKIQDNGLGIDINKHQNKLFQMFKRFHNHVPGSGLGLYIVNRLLTNQDGYITIESTLNKGTAFYLYFKQLR
ncbi:PAS domain-containing sensor histidine kinase [Pontibacter arcticus]|uniref:histidine kinase n=1 Tax=Pontibacter arcticus TaxID=2080288 RepID=A0A364RIB4_9BACT|nr:PAS domain-containing protein [Pontibacter arcticus]RAU84013.1 hypothetical protein DP923_02845 [Pontibacter arcticus]